MYCSKALLILLASCAWAADFSGSAALEYTRKAVAFGQRPPGSPANKRLQAYIETELQRLNCQTSFDAFSGQTPAGSVAMRKQTSANEVSWMLKRDATDCNSETGRVRTAPGSGEVAIGRSGGIVLKAGMARARSAPRI